MLRSMGMRKCQNDDMKRHLQYDYNKINKLCISFIPYFPSKIRQHIHFESDIFLDVISFY